MQVNDANIEKGLKEKSGAIVLFYASWCPYCKRFKPEFEEYESRTKIALAEALIDEDENPLWDKYNIMVVPTMVAFKNGKAVSRRDGKPAKGLSKADMDSLLKEIDG